MDVIRESINKEIERTKESSLDSLDFDVLLSKSKALKLIKGKMLDYSFRERKGIQFIIAHVECESPKFKRFYEIVLRGSDLLYFNSNVCSINYMGHNHEDLLSNFKGYTNWLNEKAKSL